MKRLFAFFFFLVVVGSAYAQKIKYKDLFFVLDTKNYIDGEPLLKEFLKDPKNVDEPNANLQMAYLFEMKAFNSDVILEAEQLAHYVDSALIYYRNSLQLIDEKEVTKKNKEYYQAYQRRDIRTGKFGIKLADIVFDIESKIKVLDKRKADVQELEIYYTKTLQNYDAALSDFKEIKLQYPTEKILYLRSNNDLIGKLDQLSNNTQLSLENYNSFKLTLDKIDKSGYGPALHMTEIENFEEDGLIGIDLTSDNIYFTDYQSWVEIVKKGIEEVITPMRSELVDYDQSLNSLIERVTIDSMAMADRIEPIEPILKKVREYDSDPLPQYLFQYKVAKIKLESVKMTHLYYRDSSDILYQKAVANLKNAQVSIMDSLVNLLIGRNVGEDQKNYAYFIEKQYGKGDELELYFKSELDKIINLKKNSVVELELLDERTKWLIGELDSIPLFNEVNIGITKYAPLIQEKDFTAGLYFSGKSAAEGYFALIDQALTQRLKVNFPIDNEYFKKQTFEEIGNLTVIEEGGAYYYVMFYYQIPEKEEYASSVAKIYTSDGLAWSKDYILDTRPIQLVINYNTGDIIIEYDIDNYLGEKDISDRMVLTKKGAKK